MNPDLLKIICCPVTKQNLSFASQEQLDALNLRISQGTCLNFAGKVISDKIHSALIREDGKNLFPIRDGIPVLLMDESITC